MSTPLAGANHPVQQQALGFARAALGRRTRVQAPTPAAEGTALASLLGVVLTPLVLPWRHVGQRSVRQAAEPWR